MENTDSFENLKPAPIGKPALQNGVLAGIAFIVIAIIYFLAGQSQHWSSGLISYIVLLGAIIYGTKSYRDEMLDGYIKYGRAVGFGVLLALFAGIISGLYTFVFYKFISPESLQALVIDAKQRVIETNPDLTDSEFDMAMAFARFFINPYFFFVSSVFSTTFFGTIFSLIVAAVLKKEKPIDFG